MCPRITRFVLFGIYAHAQVAISVVGQIPYPLPLTPPQVSDA